MAPAHPRSQRSRGRGSIALRLPRSPSAPSVAREALSAAALDPERYQIAAVLVSELVANAVRHGAGALRMRAEWRAERLEVSVSDEGDGFERTATRDAGMGLRLVDRLADAWGVERAPTRVWFSLQSPG